MFLSISLQKLMKSVRARGDFQLTTNFRLGSIATLPMNDVLFGIQREIILSLSDREDCVIVGRCANHILTGDDTLHIFIYAPFETRVKTIMERLDREEKSARKLVKRMDKERRAYYEFFTDQKWMDMGQYDLCIDSSKFSQDAIIQIIKEAAAKK